MADPMEASQSSWQEPLTVGGHSTSPAPPRYVSAHIHAAATQVRRKLHLAERVCAAVWDSLTHISPILDVPPFSALGPMAE